MKKIKPTALLSALLLASCAMIPGSPSRAFIWPAAWSTAQPGEAKYGGELRDWYVPYTTFNPFTILDTGLGPLRYTELSAALLKQDPATNAWLPYMAEALPSVSDGGKVYTVQLRQGMKFSDGTEITADDFITTWKIHADKDVKSLLRGRYFVGDQPVTLQKLGRYTLQFAFPAVTALPQATLNVAPWPAHVFGPVYEKGGAAAIRAMWGKDLKPGEMVTAGMFKVAENTPQGVRFVKNPYWGEWNRDSQGRALPYLDGAYVAFQTGPDDSSFARFLRGELDRGGASSSATAGQLKDAIAAGKLSATLLTGTPIGNYEAFLIFNWNRSADPWKQALFRNAKFRQAMSALFDRDKIARAAWGDLGEAAYNRVPAMHRAYLPADLPKFPYDPAAAARLLAELGFAQKDSEGYLVDAGGKRLEFDLTSYTGASTKTILDLFVADAKAAGVKINARQLPSAELFAPLDADITQTGDRPFDAILAGDAGYNLDWPFKPDDLRCDTTARGYNAGTCLTPEEKRAAELYDQGFSEPDAAKRAIIGQQLARLLAEQQFVIPLYSVNSYLAYHSRLGGEFPAALMNAVTRERALALTFIR